MLALSTLFIVFVHDLPCHSGTNSMICDEYIAASFTKVYGGIACRLKIADQVSRISVEPPDIERWVPQDLRKSSCRLLKSRAAASGRHLEPWRY